MVWFTTRFRLEADKDGSITPPAIAEQAVSSAALAKNSIRTSLKASTLDGVFAAIYSNVTGGVLLTNFVMDLGASATQIGLLASIPLVANLFQPLGAYWSEQTTSRHWYCLWIYAPSRLLWLLLLVGMGLLGRQQIDAHTLILWTLVIALLSYAVGALGSAAWLSWMAMLVPRRLRGRYFGLRNSAANLTSLVAVPLAGVVISRWAGGAVQGFGLVLAIAMVSGLVSLGFQNFMTDINPKRQHELSEPEKPIKTLESVNIQSVSGQIDAAQTSLWQHWTEKADFWMFLLYFSGWMFAFSLGAPFFNLYMLDNLDLDISKVTLYNSLMAGANLLMLTVWGRLADRIGNRPLLVGAGLILALTSLLWLFIGTDTFSVWLWLPLLHLAIGGAAAAIDLCSNNLQIGVAPIANQSTYFGWIAAAAGVSGALGTTLGGYLAEHWTVGGLLGLFVVSSGCRTVALLPLMFVREHRSVSLRELVRVFATEKAANPDVVS
jgi:MFS family permease